jgi:hypothetical protein
MSEATEQMKVVEWCHTQAYLAGTPWRGVGSIYHIPNGGWRSKSEAGRLKAMGVRAGIPDLFLPVMSGKYGGLYIEMKYEGGRASKEQIEMMEILEAQGYKSVLANGADEAIKAIKDYLVI